MKFIVESSLRVSVYYMLYLTLYARNGLNRVVLQRCMVSERTPTVMAVTSAAARIACRKMVSWILRRAGS